MGDACVACTLCQPKSRTACVGGGGDDDGDDDYYDDDEWVSVLLAMGCESNFASG